MIITWAIAILFIHSFYDANLRSLLAKKQFEPPLDNIEDLLAWNRPFYIDTIFTDHQAKFMGQSGIAARRTLFKQALENKEMQSYMRVRGGLPISLYENLIKGKFNII